MPEVSGIRARLGWRGALAIALSAVLLGLSWWRSPVSLRPSSDIAVIALPIPEAQGEAPVRVAGIWELEGSGAGFGGFSALIAMPGNQLRGFSDRGWRITFPIPGESAGPIETAQVIPARGYNLALFDIESATTSPSGEQYWLGYEATHAIHRFAQSNSPGPVRELEDEVDWPLNAGIEAMALLADRRMLAFAEGQPRGYIFDGDPAEGAAMRSFAVDWPEAGYKPTAAAQLPDGRVLVLMRRFTALPLPRFATLLAIGDVPEADKTWEPSLFTRLDPIVPSENYEGLAVRSLADGSSELWLISDDNFSAFQRTLLVRLLLPPAR